MPTCAWFARFRADFGGLSSAQQVAFLLAVEQSVADVEVGSFRKGLRVKGVKGAPGIFEMTWAPNGRATIEYGAEIHADSPHVVWRRVGTHDIFKQP